MRIFGSDVDVATMAIPGAHKNAEPEMPSQFDGKVKVDLLVNEQGRIIRDVPLSGDAEHVELMEEGLDRWRFHPWVVNERSVAFHTTMTIDYRKALWVGGGGVVGMGSGAVLKPAPPVGAVGVNIGERTGGNAPVYPAVAKAARIQGVVTLKGTITEQGTVADLSVVSGPPLLQKAAMEAVSTWTYKPVTKEGKPVRVITQINVVFSLGQTPDRSGAPVSQAAPDTSQPNSTPQ
jgi:TonB family protein